MSKMRHNIRRLDNGKYLVRFKLPYDIYGKGEYKKTFFDLKDAERHRNEMAIIISDRQPLPTKLVSSPLLRDLIEQSAEHYREKDPRRIYARRWIEWAGDRDIRQIDGRMIQMALKAMQEAGYMPATLRTAIAALQPAFALAEELEIIESKKNPFNKRGRARAIKLPKISKRKVSITGSDLRAIFREAGPYANIIRFYILTGLRCQELLGLTWEFVDLERRYFEIQADRTKTTKDHRIPLEDPLLEILLEQRGIDPIWVFPRAPGVPWTYNSFTHARRRWFTAAGRPKLRIHDLRHVTAILAIAAGTPLHVVKELLNHENSKMTEWYLAQENSQVGQAIQGIAGYLKGMLAN